MLDEAQPFNRGSNNIKSNKSGSISFNKDRKSKEEDAQLFHYFLEVEDPKVQSISKNEKLKGNSI